MLYEYAVEPQAIGSNWQTCRYIIEKFGFDKGRLISKFPSRWFGEAYQAAKALPETQRKRVEELLAQAKKSNKVVSFKRDFDSTLETWLDSALAAHQNEPFHAIISAENPGGDESVLCIDDLDENHTLMAVTNERDVLRNVGSLTTAFRGMLRFGKRIAFIDPYFSPYNSGYRRIMLQLLSIVKDYNPRTTCEIHYHSRAKNLDNAHLEREAATLLKDIIPDGMNLTVYCWCEKEGGEDFHLRGLLTDKGGIRIDAGFEPVGAHQTTEMGLMDFNFSQSRLARIEREATVYELIEPVLCVSANGDIKHV